MNAADILKYGHRTFQRTLEGVPDGEWEAGGVCGVWSVKDITAHLASYEHWLIEILSGFVEGHGGAVTPAVQRMGELGPDGWNGEQVSARKSKTPEAVRAEYNDAQAKSMTLAAQITGETWRQAGTLPWYGPEYSLDDFIVYTFYGHKREHSAQIDVFKDRLKQRQ